MDNFFRTLRRNCLILLGIAFIFGVCHKVFALEQSFCSWVGTTKSCQNYKVQNIELIAY